MIVTLSQTSGWVATRAGQTEENGTPAPAPIQTFGLGDWVESWAKPIGCWLDRLTNAAPTWLIAQRRTTNLLMFPPLRVRRRLRYRLTHSRWRLPASWRTTFCAAKPGCGCQRRKAKLNALLPDLRSAHAWQTACKTLFWAMQARFIGIFSDTRGLKDANPRWPFYPP